MVKTRFRFAVRFFVLAMVGAAGMASPNAHSNTLPSHQAPLDWNTRREAFLLVGGLAMNLAANAKLASAPATRPEQYARQDLWAHDRWVAGAYRPEFAHVSDWLVVPVTGALPLIDAVAAMTGHATWKPLAEDMLILSQALAWSSSLNLMVRAAAVHPRPLVFNSSAPLEERTAPEARGSFYSGHANASFAGIALAATLLPHRYPGLNPVYVWSVGGALAATVAGLRVAAGKHYPSDVLVGAAVGSAFGWAFARWHLPGKAHDRGQVVLQPDPRGGLIAALRF